MNTENYIILHCTAVDGETADRCGGLGCSLHCRSGPFSGLPAPHRQLACWEVPPQRIDWASITLLFYYVSFGLLIKLNLSILNFISAPIIIVIINIYFLLIMNLALAKHFALVHAPSRAWSRNLNPGNLPSHSQLLNMKHFNPLLFSSFYSACVYVTYPFHILERCITSILIL